jgi:glycopeptide antibiotics resistance protein
VLLRKAYSILAFGLAGILADKALGPARRPALRAALVVAAFSVAIEVGQKLHHAREGLLSNLFDVLCGALGGWLGVSLVRALARR